MTSFFVQFYAIKVEIQKNRVCIVKTSPAKWFKKNFDQIKMVTLLKHMGEIILGSVTEIKI